MKRILTIILTLSIIILALCGCSAKDDGETTEKAAAVSAKMPTVLNTAEYTLYQNVFYNDTKADYDGKEAKKEGTFATIHDAYNDVTRYYVWGYNDNTKCCDWQWELKIDNEKDIPSNGSLVTVSGTYATDDAALDGLWIADPQITVKTEYKASDYDIDMLAMDNTLERVQAYNITQMSDAFEGKTVCCYGRVKDAETLQDAYYDGSWEMGISGDFELPAFGTTVLVYGTVKSGALVNCTIAENTQY